MTISDQMLSKMACPKCKGDLARTDDGAALVCNQCQLKFKIVDDIPVMLLDEAEAQG